MSVVTMACCLGAMQASALTVNVNSKIAYDLYVEKVSNNRVALHINFTNNAEFTTLGFRLYYDDACTLLTNKTEYSGISMFETYSDSNKCVVYSFINTNAFSGDFSITCYFTTSDSANNSHAFTTEIMECNLGHTSIIGTSAGVEVDFVTNTPYTLGDINNDGEILLNDVQSILEIANMNGGNWVSLSYATSNFSTLKQSYPNLVCAEVADVDFDKKISTDDGMQVMQYYAEERANVDNENACIGTQYYKTITLATSVAKVQNHTIRFRM